MALYQEQFMIISKKSLLKPCLAIAGLAVFLVGCKSEPEAGTTTAATGSTASTTPPASGASAVTFAAVEPIFKSRCLQCHNGPQGKEGVDFSSYASVMKGGNDGPIVVANDAESSLIVKVIHGTDDKPKMPPQGDPLTADQMKTIEDWIKSGAAG
jgi:uncharacterized membrane protein